MKSGFTLIELLIVMVIVGILVTIALPKYNASLERARAQEGIANIKAASDMVNARYVMDGNTYDNARANLVDANGNFRTGDFTKSKYFNSVRLGTFYPGIDLTMGPSGGMIYNTGYMPVISRMEGDDVLYMLWGLIDSGDFIGIICIASDYKYCEEIGAEKKDGMYMIVPNM